MPSGQLNTVVISVPDILPLDKGHYISDGSNPIIRPRKDTRLDTISSLVFLFHLARNPCSLFD